MPKQPTLQFKSSENIKTYRQKHHMNQTKFWARVGVTQSGGSRYESGRNVPKPVQLLLQLAYGTPKQSADMLAWLRGTND
jgi:DNA-binding transcriptional regulator YiaG